MSYCPKGLGSVIFCWATKKGYAIIGVTGKWSDLNNRKPVKLRGRHEPLACLCGHADRHTTAAENGAAGVKPLGGLVDLPLAKASIPVRRRGTSRSGPLPSGYATLAPFQGASWRRSTGICPPRVLGRRTTSIRSSTSSRS